MATKAHHAPDACYICGYVEDQHGENAGHNFWSNEQARKDFANEPQWRVNVEAEYVSQYRPY